MKQLPYLLLTLLAAVSLTACDPKNSPGTDPQRSQDFSNIPPATSNETDRDSISSQQRVEKPIGRGSAADQQTSVDAGIQSAPGNRASPTSTMPDKSPELQGTAREN